MFVIIKTQLDEKTKINNILLSYF